MRVNVRNPHRQIDSNSRHVRSRRRRIRQADNWSARASRDIPSCRYRKHCRRKECSTHNLASSGRHPEMRLRMRRTRSQQEKRHDHPARAIRRHHRTIASEFSLHMQARSVQPPDPNSSWQLPAGSLHGCSSRRGNGGGDAYWSLCPQRCEVVRQGTTWRDSECTLSNRAHRHPLVITEKATIIIIIPCIRSGNGNIWRDKSWCLHARAWNLWVNDSGEHTHERIVHYVERIVVTDSHASTTINRKRWMCNRRSAHDRGTNGSRSATT